MERELPVGWVEIKIEGLTKIVAGGTPNTSVKEYFDGGIPWLTPADLSGYRAKYISRGKRNLTEKGLKNSSARLLPKGSVLFSSRAPIGYVVIAENEIATNQGFKSLIPNNTYSSDYAYYYLKFIKDYAESQASGTTFKELSGSKMGQLPFLLPPLAEQERIVAKLDTAFAHLETLKTSLARIPELLKKFRQTVLTQAVTGRLTEEWRNTGSKKNLTWETVLLNSVCERITDGDHQAPPKSDIGIPFIVITDVSNGKLNLTQASRYVPETYYQSINEYRKPRKGDVLYTVTGSIGIPIYVDVNEQFCFQRHIGLIRPNTSYISSLYLYYLLSSKSIYNQAKEVATGTAQLTIPLGGIRNFILSLPPLEEQQEIVTRVEALFAKADAIEAQYQRLKEKIDRLPQALLAKAFRGELVPQDPTDEPASVLLEKIKSDTEKLTKKSKKQMSLVFGEE